MAKVKLDFGAEVDFLTRDELGSELKRSFDAEWSARARGMKRLQFKLSPAANLTANLGYVLPNTPNQGYTWNIRSIASSLSASQAVNYYLGSDTVTGAASPATLMPLAHNSSSVVAASAWGSGQAWMDPGDYVAIWAGGVTILQAVYMVVIETPAELAWKLM